MIFTLHRYIFRELFRVFLLTTIALTLALSTGLMFRPIEEYGVGPGQMLRLLGYFLPITLTFVLPMAALFAGALVYGRLAYDRELDACRASGIGLMALVYPGMFLAVMVSISTLVMSFNVAPNFVRRAERAVKANARQILFRNVQRRGHYDIKTDGNRYVVYADRTRPAHNTLEGVIIVKQRTDRITELVTARAARIDIDTHSRYYDIGITALDSREFDEYRQADVGRVSFSSRMPSLLEDNIRFQTIDRIKEIRADPLAFYPLHQRALEARTQLLVELLAQDIRHVMAHTEDYYELVAPDRVVLLSVGAVTVGPGEKWRLELGGPIRLLELDSHRQKLICEWNSDTGSLYFDDQRIDGTLDLVLRLPTWDRGGGVSNIAERHVIKELAVPPHLAAQAPGENLLAAIRSCDRLVGRPSDILLQMRNELDNRIRRTMSEIFSETHSKLVLGLGCIPLILTGIALGILLRGGHLLSAFGASSIPAGALIIFIVAGKDLVKNPSTPVSTGIFVMWTGLTILSVLTLVVYRKVTRV